MEDVEVSNISMVDHHGRPAYCLPCLSVAMQGQLHMSLDCIDLLALMHAEVIYNANSVYAFA